MLIKRFMVSVFSCALLFLTSNCGAVANQEDQAAAPAETQPVQVTAEQAQQLVAPIALYPDELVAQILAASTYPTEIVEAERWLQQNSSLKGAQLASEVDKQSWDPSVKALTQFPSVLANMDKNLSWTSALGDAYFNDQQTVLNAVQVMRKRAQDAGTLKTTPQQNVTTQGQTIIIEPANPQVVYLPQYDPWLIYGAPLAVYPGYFAGPWIGGPIISFGIGFPIGWGFVGVGDGPHGAATGAVALWFLITRGLFPGAILFSTTATDSPTAAISTVTISEATRITSTIEPIVDSLRHTWSGATAPAHSADSTTAAWPTSTPSAASPASGEVCTVVLGLRGRHGWWRRRRHAWRRWRRPPMIGFCSGKQFVSKKTGMEVSTMMRIRDSVQKIRWWTVVKLAPVALFVLWTFGFIRVLMAEPSGHKTFSSAAQASRALFLAAQAGDETALLEIFGADGKEIVSSGDPVEDKNSETSSHGNTRR